MQRRGRKESIDVGHGCSNDKGHIVDGIKSAHKSVTAERKIM